MTGVNNFARAARGTAFTLRRVDPVAFQIAAVARAPARNATRPNNAKLRRNENAEPVDRAEKALTRQKAEPTEPIEPIEPADPMDRIDPVEPMDRIEPEDPIDRMEPDDPSERMESWPAVPIRAA